VEVDDGVLAAADAHAAVEVVAVAGTAIRVRGRGRGVVVVERAALGLELRALLASATAQYHITRPLAPSYSLHTVLLKV
jgi:hypothetical protein